MQVQPYLFFDGKCEEAVAFYKAALGAEVLMVMHFKDSPDPAHIPPGASEKVMHMSLKIGETMLMASDGFCKGEASFKGFSLSLAARDEAEAQSLFGALSEGGQVQVPLGPTFFAKRFGVVADRFGVSWMVIAEA